MDVGLCGAWSYISHISPLYLPYISQVLAAWKASAAIASYYDAGVRLSSKPGESGLGLGLTSCHTPTLTLFLTKLGKSGLGFV